MSHPLLTFDTLSDRRDLWTLLHRLHPRRRVAFLTAACRSVERPGNPCPVPDPDFWRLARDATHCERSSEKLTTTVYTCLASISAQYDLDLMKAAVKLEELVRKGG